ncbi:hypothetical protein CF650_37325, partial [Burkholderia sp. 129]
MVFNLRRAQLSFESGVGTLCALTVFDNGLIPCLLERGLPATLLSERCGPVLFELLALVAQGFRRLAFGALLSTDRSAQRRREIRLVSVHDRELGLRD